MSNTRRATEECAAWLAMPITRLAAIHVQEKYWYNPEYRCTYGHQSPQTVSGWACMVCQTLKSRSLSDAAYETMKQKPKKKYIPKSAINFSPVLPRGCKPERTAKNLLVDDERRHMNCDYYMFCLSYAWHGLPSNNGRGSWICGATCENTPVHVEDHSVQHRPLPYTYNRQLILDGTGYAKPGGYGARSPYDTKPVNTKQKLKSFYRKDRQDRQGGA